MTFSEFGRRVQENISLGTDHGAGNSSFVIGGQVRGGIYGIQPNLTELQKGNLIHDIDFRSVYAKVILDWFGADTSAVFDQEFFDATIAGQLPGIDFVRRAGVKAGTWTRY